VANADDGYAVAEDTVIGRIYKEMIHGEDKWLWSLQCIPEVGPGRPIPLPKKEWPLAWMRRRRRHSINDIATPDRRTTLSSCHARERGRNGATQALLSALGFDASLIADLVSHGLVTLKAEKVRAGGKLMEVAKARITDAGRDALAAEC
jgi:hypothetical protein